MAILIDENTRVLVQGITGRSGSLQARIMRQYGTKVVAGVTPGKGGQSVDGVPVYDFVRDAVREHPVDAAITFVPAQFARDATIELMDSGIRLIVLPMEGLADHDVSVLVEYAKSTGTRIVGPGSAGIISPGKAKIGAHPPKMFAAGSVGVVTKSGSLSYEIGKNLTEAGFGQSTVLALGGGPMWATTAADVLELFERDSGTDIVVLGGEIGGSMEEEAAAVVRTMSKPVVALVVGRTAPQGKSLGHAGAIVQGNRGSAAGKISELQNAGALIARTPAEVVRAVRELRGESK